MTLTELGNAHPWIGQRWSSGEASPEEKEILALARDSLDFIFATGQRYRFEDFSGDESKTADHPSQGSPELRARLSKAQAFFEGHLHASNSADEKAQLQAILQAFRFIASTRQYEALNTYLKHVESNAPPFVVASFETLNEAEAWLRSHPHPPDPANVLIAGHYHDVVYDRETNRRLLPWNRHLHGYLAELKRVDPPVAVASFSTLEEAKAWLERQAEPAMKQWVSIGGKLYLAAYYPNIRHRALYPLAMIEGWD
jgi:hypothetical protein